MAGGELRGYRAEILDGAFGVSFGGFVGVEQTPGFEQLVRVEGSASDGGDRGAERGEGGGKPARGVLAAERVDDGRRRVLGES